MARTGRRPGPSTTRAAILEVARRRFAEVGYDGTSVRAIAADAGVDPGVVLHFFGSKEGLFRTAVGWPFDPEEVAPRIAAQVAGSPGERLARVFLGYWEEPATRASLVALLRSAMTHETSATLLRRFVGREIFGRLAADLPGPEADLRANLAAAQLIGVALLRYVLEVEPVASAGLDELVTRLSPALDHHLAPAAAADAA